MSTQAVASAPTKERSFWSRELALYGAAWVPFLTFPMYDLLDDDDVTGVRRIVAILLIVGYGLTHLSFSQIFPPNTSTSHPRKRLLVLALLAAVAGVVCLISIRPGLGLLPFVAAWAVFNMAGNSRWLVAVCCLGFEIRYAIVHRDLSMTWLVLLTMVCAVVGLIAEVVVRRAREANIAEQHELIIAERDRMARDVHDLLGHSLTMVALKVQLAERLVDSAPDRAKTELKDAHRAITVAIGDVRRTVEGVHLTTLEEALTKAKAALTDAGVSVTVVGEVADIRGKVAIALSWVVQELATNVIRHSKATRVSVEITPHRLVFIDNGTGLGESSPGNGLRGMRERLSTAGASFDATSLEEPQHGTRTVVGW